MPTTAALKGGIDGRRIGARRMKGGSELARELGVSPNMISYRMRNGETPAQIRAYYHAQGIGVPAKVGKVKVESNGKGGSVYQGANKYKPQLPTPPPAPDDDEDADTPEGLPSWIPGALEQNEFATLNSAKIRKEVALADKHELDLAERRRELVNREQVRLFVSGMVTRARDMVLKIPGELKDR